MDIKINEVLSEDKTGDDIQIKLEKAKKYEENGKYKDAFQCYKDVAEFNNIEAICKLAYLYNKGLGVEKNEIEALSLYMKASKLNSGEAQYNLGIMYRGGIATIQNNEKAFYYFSKAAENGYIKALVNVG